MGDLNGDGFIALEESLGLFTAACGNDETSGNSTCILISNQIVSSFRIQTYPNKNISKTRYGKQAMFLNNTFFFLLQAEPSITMEVALHSYFFEICLYQSTAFATSNAEPIILFLQL